MKKKILIFKNDRTGDLFVSLNAINKILNKHISDDIEIILSNINHKFCFLFPNIKKRIFGMKLRFYEKIKIFFFFLFNNVEVAYILTPKNFYYYLPFFFRNTKFYAITIKTKQNRPSNFLLKYLYRYVSIDRINILKRKSSYLIQSELIDSRQDKNLISNISEPKNNFSYPDNSIYFHYKENLFKNLLQWNLETTCFFIEYLSTKYENILFSSELNNEKLNTFFMHKYNSFDYDKYSAKKLNDRNIIFLKNIDGIDLFDAVNKSKKIISPEGIITHMGYFLKKPVLALMHFNLKNKQDFINQIISCKEWFPPNNYEFIVLKKDFDNSIKKLSKRI